MNHTEIFARIQSGSIDPVYLWYGQEELVKHRAMELLCQTVLPDGMQSIDLHKMEGDVPIQSIINSCETIPLMAQRRVVIVMDWQPLCAGREAQEQDARLTSWLQSPPDTAVLVFYCREKPDKRGKSYSLLKKHATEVVFDPLGEGEIHRWIAQQCRQRGIAIQPDALEWLLFCGSGELQTIENEMEKLFAYVEDQETIGLDAVKALVTQSAAVKVFDMMDALAQRRVVKAILVYESLMTSGDSPFAVLSLFARQVRNMLLIREGQAAGVSMTQLAEQIKVSSFIAKKIAQQAQSFSIEQLRALLAQCAQTDWDIKSGMASDRSAVEKLLLMIGVEE